MKKRMLIMLVAVIIFIAVIGGYKMKQVRAGIAMMKQMTPPPTAVTTIVVGPVKWQPTLNAVGSLKAVNGVTVSTDLPGIVAEIKFQSGATVKKGDLLVRLDSQQEEAQLRSAEARRDLAKLIQERQQKLIVTGAVAKSSLDEAESMYRQAVAAVDEAQALIARKNITAAFDGQLGIRKVDLGQYLNVGAEIVQLESMDPIYVEFALPQQNLNEISIGKQIRIHAAGLDGEEFSGEITAIESRLDSSTRNFSIQGTVKNTEHKLKPGMFVNIKVLMAEQTVISVPASSISYAPYGDSVFIVKDGKAMQQFVKLGESRGDQIAIVSGVKPSDEVVSSGVFKLRNSLPVQVDNSVQPGNETNPKPANM